MKTLKAICTTVTLVLVLSVPASAGDVLTPGYTAPPPPPPPQSLVSTEPNMDTETPVIVVDPNAPNLTDIFFLLLAIF